MVVKSKGKKGGRALKSPALQRRAAEPEPLEYKVVELATVDEAGLERVLNTWSPQGYRLENVQFAMRESSRRPSMAFVFLSRAMGQGSGLRSMPGTGGERDAKAGGAVRPVDQAWARLHQLAHGGEEPR